MKLNEYQKKAIWVGAVIILLMGLFPPWTYTFKSASVYSEKPTGYAFLFWPPPPEKSSYLHGVRLNFNRLFLQWFMVAGACVGLLLWLKTTTEDRSTKPQHLMTEEELSRIAKEYLKKLVKLGFQIKITPPESSKELMQKEPTDRNKSFEDRNEEEKKAWANDYLDRVLKGK